MAGKVLAVSDIPYYHCVEVDGITYSLDKFRPRFYFPDPKIIPDKVIEAMTTLAGEYAAVAGHTIRQGPGRIGGTLHWWSFDGVVVSLCVRKSFVRVAESALDDNGDPEWTGKVTSIPEDQHFMLLEFNPNKHIDNPILPMFLDLVRAVPNWAWSNTRLDCTIDVPYQIDDVRLLSRKTGSCYLGTYYFGQRGKTGYTRVYDKRKEMAEKYGIDIQRDVTRVEYEVRGASPVTMDPPFLLGNLGTHEVFRFVPMDRWHDALCTLDPRTARRFKKSALKEIPFDRSVFDGLYTDLLARIGLDQAHNKDRAAALDLQESEDIEVAMAQLRKWSGFAD